MAGGARAAQAGRTAMDARVLVEVRGCRQAYHKDSAADLVGLDDVDLTLV